MDSLSSNLSLHLNQTYSALSNSKSIRGKLLNSAILRESSSRSSSLPQKKFKYLTESHPIFPSKSKPVVPPLKLSQLTPKQKPRPRARSTLIKEKKPRPSTSLKKPQKALTRSKIIQQSLNKLVTAFTVKKVLKLKSLKQDDQSTYQLANAFIKFMKPFDKSLANIKLKQHQEFFWEKFLMYVKQPGRITQNVRKLPQFIKQIELTRTEINSVKSHLHKTLIKSLDEAANSVYQILTESLSLIQALNSEGHQFKITTFPVITRKNKGMSKNKTMIMKKSEPKCIPILFEPVTIQEEKKPQQSNVYAASDTDSSQEEPMDITADTQIPLALCKNELLKKFFLREGKSFTENPQLDLVQTFVPEKRRKSEQWESKINSNKGKSVDLTQIEESRLNKSQESILHSHYRGSSLDNSVVQTNFLGLDEQIRLANQLANREKKKLHKLLAKYKK